MMDIMDEEFFKRNDERFANVAQRIIEGNADKIKLGIGYYIQLFRWNKEPDSGFYMSVFELNKVSLEEVKWKVMKVEKFDSEEDYNEMKRIMGGLMIDIEYNTRIIEGN